MVYLDLDNFKQVNDRLGLHAGEEVLATVADRVREMLSRDELVARLGSEKFAIAVEDATSSACVALSQRVIYQIAKPYLLSTGNAVNYLPLEPKQPAPEPRARNGPYSEAHTVRAQSTQTCFRG
jgi:diguanylate cyclase (GGDEF)-like protein